MRPIKAVFRGISRVLGALRAEKRQLVNRYFGKIERFEGNARQICEQIIDRLWQGKFYRTSLGHFDFFWMRDFGTVAEALTKIGKGDRVRWTLEWALKHYRRAGLVTLCIDSYGNTFNAPNRKSIDAVPWLLHSIYVSGYKLSNVERKFLNKELRKYVRTFLDKKSGLIKTMEFAELRDAVIYDRSAYALSMVGRMAFCAKRLELIYPYDVSVYRNELNRNYWTGDYFSADAVTTAFSAECALFPFYMGVVNDEEKAGKTFDYIEKKNLNDPYPMKYTDDPDAFNYRWWMKRPFMPNYAGTSVWSWHGVFYLHLLNKYKRPEYHEQKVKLSRMIERHKTWPEMLNPNGSWYLAPVYKGDPGMVWAALYLTLK